MADKRSGAKSAFDDDFENPPAGPIGLHRGKPSGWAVTRPYVLTLVIAVLLGLCTYAWVSGKFSFLSRPQVTTSSSASSSKESHKIDNKKSAKKDTASSQSSSSSTSDQKDEQKKDDSQNQDQQNQPAAQPVNQGAQVGVYNALGAQYGAQRNGYAGRQAQVLRNAGYTNVSTGNLQTTAPTANTVWYSNDADKSTAEDVAAKFGITAVQKVDTALDYPIEVVFVSM